MSDLTSHGPRGFDVRAAPLAVWLLVGLALLDVVIRFRSGGSFSDPARIPSLVLVAAPFLFAAAVVYAAPTNKRILWGAVVLALAELVGLMSVVLRPPWLDLGSVSEAAVLIGRLSTFVTLVGLITLGVGLGGLHSRLALLAAAVGGSVFVLGQAWSAARLLDPASDLALPFDQIIILFFAPLVTVGWAFVAGAGFDRGLLFIPTAAALIVGYAAVNTIVIALSLTSPETDFGLLVAIATPVQLMVWGSLIWGGLTESGPRAEDTGALDEDAPQPDS